MRQIVDADLSGYFDSSSPFADLIKSVARRVVDGSDAPSDQNVAGSSGGGNRREGEISVGAREIGMKVGELRRELSDQPVC
jgi:hypothetical protein